jgi:hypothetical protein
MRIEKLETGYKLTDLYITAAILCEPNMVLEGVEPAVAGNKQTMFVVKGDPVRIKEIIDNFFNGKHMVDASAYKGKVQSLKSRIYAKF